MKKQLNLTLVLWFFLIFAFAASSAKETDNIRKRESNHRVRRSLFPGPVTPDRACPQRAGSPQASVPQEKPQGLEDQLRRLWFSRNTVTGNKSVLLLQYAERLVLNRAYFLTLAMQMQNSKYEEFRFQPGFLYYYVSQAAALFSAPEALFASGVFFDANRHYPNWYTRVWFNGTIPRFAPRATRQPATPELRVDDYGADVSGDYTLPADGQERVPQTMVYRFQRQNKFGDVEDLSIVGAPDQGALRASDLYYDCAHGDRWLQTLAAPVVDVLPRYTMYTYLKKPRYVAAATADLDVMQLLAGPPPEVPGFHNMLALMLQCPGPVPPAPASGSLSHSFFRSLNPQCRQALRLAHTLSAFLQTLGPVTEELDYAGNGITYGPYQPVPDTPSAKIKADQPLNNTLLEAEVLANLLADPQILASGIFFTTERVPDSQGNLQSTPIRAIQAWRGARGPVVGDLSAAKDPNSRLTSRAQAEWDKAHQDPRVRTFSFHAGIRSSKEGGALADFAVDPLQYRSVSLAEGHWTAPYYKCDHYVDQWVVTYATPFFGPSVAEPGKLILRGTVTVDIAVTADNWAA